MQVIYCVVAFIIVWIILYMSKSSSFYKKIPGENNSYKYDYTAITIASIIITIIVYIIWLII